MDHAHRGAIVLLHDGGAERRQTIAALPRIVRGLRGRGYHLPTITALLGGRMRTRAPAPPPETQLQGRP
jgi:peptidoglycan/xylan/chitin deacetylase (PgdA/CDA1 family)